MKGRINGKAARPKRAASGTITDASLDKGKAGVMKLRLYIAGQTPKSLTALNNLRKICEAHLEVAYQLEVIDLVRTPQLAQGDQILAIPTLVRSIPKPARKIIGDLSNTEKVLVGLDIRAANE